MPTCHATGISVFFSTLSLMSWVCAQLPQIIANYRAKTADGISLSFLLLWFMGDFLSFTSCLLNDAALSFQIYLSLFFIANDITLCYQYYYYNSVYPRKQATITSHVQEEPEFANYSTDIQQQAESMHIRSHKHGAESNIRSTAAATPSSSLSSWEAKDSHGSFGSSENSPRLSKIAIAAAVLNADFANAMTSESIIVATSTGGFKEAVALFLAWACTSVYISSRYPQLYKNYLRKSVEGISPLLFSAALVGNLTYTLSILTSCEFLGAENKADFFWKQLPYILGSSGTIVFDAAYFYQRHIYGSMRRQNNVGLESWVGEPDSS